MSELNFNLSASDLEANSLPPILNSPVIEHANLVSVVVDTINGDYDIVDFNFKLLAGEYKGHEFRHRVFKFKPFENSQRTPEEDQINWGKHLAYIMGYFIGQDTALKIMNESGSWDSMRENIDRAFKAPALAAWKQKIVKLKILGYVTGSGKAVLGFPRYLGFISDAESATQVVFHKKELQQNAKYAAKYAAEITATGSAELVGADGGATGDLESGLDF